MTLADKLNPKRLGFSPKMAALVGAILGHDYGARDRKGNQLTGLSITSDGFVVASTNPISSGAFIGTASELESNLLLLLTDAKLTREERAEFDALYSMHVTDWR